MPFKFSMEFISEVLFFGFILKVEVGYTDDVHYRQWKLIVDFVPDRGTMRQWRKKWLWICQESVFKQESGLVEALTSAVLEDKQVYPFDLLVLVSILRAYILFLVLERKKVWP